MSSSTSNGTPDLPRILYVEDHAESGFVLQRMLARDARVDVVADVAGALRLCGETAYRIVLVDINLGSDRTDGVALLGRIRALPGYDAVKIFAVTAYALEGDRETFLAAGFDDYLSKPIDVVHLRGVIRRSLRGE